MHTTCAMCFFVDKPGPRATAAATLVLGTTDLASVWLSFAKRATQVVIPGVTAYCTSCRCVTMLTDSEDPTQTLVTHDLEYNQWSMMWDAVNQTKK